EAEGQAKAIRSVVEAIHEANMDAKVMAYQYLQTLPQIAAGESNKVWIVPVEMTKALEGIGGVLGGLGLGAGGERAGAGAAGSEEAEACGRGGDGDRAEPAGLPAAPLVAPRMVLEEEPKREPA